MIGGLSFIRHFKYHNIYIRDEELRDHIKFLETLNIAGVSHHDLLFSKQAPDVDTTEKDGLLNWDAQYVTFSFSIVMYLISLQQVMIVTGC